MNIVHRIIDKNFLFWFLAVIFCGSLASYVFQFTAWPEMFAYPWLMNHGYHLYGDIVQPYLPLLPFLLFVIFRLFGFSIAVLQVMTVFCFGASSLLVGIITKKIAGKLSALIAVIVFVLLFLLFHGNGLWFDLASMPLVLGSFLLFFSKPQTLKKNAIAFLLLGLAVLIKQTNILYVLPSLLMLKPFRTQVFLASLSLVPLGLVIVIYALTPQFRDFFYWGIWHPLFVHGRMPGFALFPTLRELFQILFILLPLSMPFLYRKQILMWIGVSLLLAFPRFADFHLLQLISFTSISVGVILHQRNRTFIRLLMAGYLWGIVFLFLIFATREVGLPPRFFDSSVQEARYELAKQIPVGRKVLFLNVPANYFVMTSVLPCKPWSDTFPWYLEVPGLQEKIIQGLEQVDYVVFSPFGNNGTYALGSYTPKTIFSYVEKHFRFQSQVSPEIQILKRF